MATQAEIEAIIKMRDELTAKAKAMSAEVDKLAKGMGGAKGKSGELQKGLADLGSQLTGLSPKMFTVAGGVAAVGLAMAAGIRNAVMMGDRITNLSRQFQMSTDAVQRLEAGGRGLGISFETLGNESNFLAKTLGSRSEGVLGALDELGLSYTRLAQMSPEQRLLAVHKALNTIKDPLKQAAVGAELLGRNFQKMSDTDLAEFEKEMNGAVIASKGALDAGDKLGDAWDKLMASSAALATDGLEPLNSALGTIIENLSFAIERFTLFNRKMEETHKTSEAIFREQERLMQTRDASGRFLSRAEALAQARQNAAGKATGAGGFVGPVLPPGVADARAAAEAKAEAARIKANEAAAKAAAKLAEEADKAANSLAVVTRYYKLQAMSPELAIPNMGGARFPGMLPTLPEADYLQQLPMAGRFAGANLSGAAPGMDFDSLGKSVELAEESAQRLGLSLEAASQIAQVFGDEMGVFGDALTQGAAAADLLKQGFDKGGLAGALDVAIGAVMGFAAIMNATESGSQGKRAAGGAMAGAQVGGAIGGAFGPIGAVIGLGVGAAVGAIVGWLRGKGPAQVGKDAGRDMGANLSQALKEAIHKSGENAQMFLTEMWAEGAIGIDRYAEEVGDLFSMFERSEISEGTLISELMEDLPILIEHFDELGEEGQANLERIIDAAKQADIDLGAMGDQLERLQKGIPELTQEGFVEQFDINEEQLAKLKELGIPIQTDLERLADDMNIPLEVLQQMGPEFEKFGVSLAELPDFLAASGLSFEELVEKMNLPPEVQQAWEDYLATLPEAPEGGAPGEALPDDVLDPLAFGNDAGNVIAERLIPGQKQLSADMGTAVSTAVSTAISGLNLPDAIARAVRDAVAAAVPG